MSMELRWHTQVLKMNKYGKLSEDFEFDTKSKHLWGSLWSKWEQHNSKCITQTGERAWEETEYQLWNKWDRWTGLADKQSTSKWTNMMSCAAACKLDLGMHFFPLTRSFTVSCQTFSSLCSSSNSTSGIRPMKPSGKSSSWLDASDGDTLNGRPKNKCRSSRYANSSFATSEYATPLLPARAHRPTNQSHCYE